MLIDWLHGDLHHWAIFCCVVASLGLVGAFWVALAAAGGKGIFAFLNGSRTPTVIVVNGGTYTPPPAKKTWGFLRVYCLCAAVFSGGPMLTLLVLAVIDLFWQTTAWLGRNWGVPLIALVAAAVVGAFWLLIRNDRLRDRQTHAQLAALPPATPMPAVAAEPVMGWSLQDYDGQWDQR